MSHKLHIGLFGTPQFIYQDKPLTGFVSNKVRALLIYLAITGRPHSRDALSELLWANTPKTKRDNLKKALSNLRNMDGVALLEEGQHLVALTPGSYWVDVVEFSTVANNGRLQAEDEMQRVVAFYQDDFLAGFNISLSLEFEAWALGQQALLKEQQLSLLSRLARALEHHNQLPQAIATVRLLLQLEPWQEEGHRHLMMLLVQSGQRHGALVQYEICRRLLDSELGVPPSAATVELYEQIREGTYDEVGPPQRSPSSPGRGDGVTTDDGSTPTPPHQLFGVDAAHDELLARLQTIDRPWLISIDGIGGIGKTSLAQAVVNALDGTDHFTRMVWVSAKQEEFQMGVGIQPTDRAAMNAEQMIDAVLQELTGDSTAEGPREKELLLLRHLKEVPTLVVVDNLETVADYEALVPTLRDLTDPSKFLITSRHALAQYNDVFCLTLGELDQQAAFELLRHEAHMRGIRSLADTADDALAQITDVVGGHPLALNLVLGQLVFLPLEQVLANLQQATGQHVDDLYTYIYWQAWETLDTPARQLFLAMPMLYNATYAQLAAVTKLEMDALQSALTQLIGLSLVQVAGDLQVPRYRLHRLTETFLMNEVLKWGGA